MELRLPRLRGRRRDADADPARVPPGQSMARDFPVLSAGPTPHTPLDRWTFSIENGGVLRTWTWEEFRVLLMGAALVVLTSLASAGLEWACVLP